MLKFSTYLFVTLSLFFTLTCSNKERVYSKVDIAFDTVCSVQIFTDKGESEANGILESVFTKLRQLELIFSPTLEESELYRLNSSDIGIPFRISEEFYHVINENLKIAKLTNGAFNPCMGQLTNLWRKLWDISQNAYEMPSVEEIEAALKCIGYDEIDLLDRQVVKKKPIWLDFGASAKGYATDCIKDILLESGIIRAVINLGGNVSVLQKKINGESWKIGIRMPKINASSRVAGFVNISNKAVVSSGNYERFFEKDGKVYHHIISSKTGFPVENELCAVTIISSSAMIADILSTSCFVLGEKEGSALLKKFGDIAAILFFKNGDVLEVNNELHPFYILDDELRYLKK